MLLDHTLAISVIDLYNDDNHDLKKKTKKCTLVVFVFTSITDSATEERSRKSPTSII